MTRRALPKPVEAWTELLPDGTLSPYTTPRMVDICLLANAIRVRIVPITPKKRTKRKEKKK